MGPQIKWYMWVWAKCCVHCSQLSSQDTLSMSAQWPSLGETVAFSQGMVWEMNSTRILKSQHQGYQEYKDFQMRCTALRIWRSLTFRGRFGREALWRLNSWQTVLGARAPSLPAMQPGHPGLSSLLFCTLPWTQQVTHCLSLGVSMISRTQFTSHATVVYNIYKTVPFVGGLRAGQSLEGKGCTSWLSRCLLVLWLCRAWWC